jgi:hypothetical protein
MNDPLTPREREVLALANAGLTNDQIATELRITRNAVRFHLKEIHSKLGTGGERGSLRGRAAGMRWRHWAGLGEFLIVKAASASATAGVVALLGVTGYMAYAYAPGRDDSPAELRTTIVHAWPGATLESFVVPGRITIETLNSLNRGLIDQPLTADSEIVVPALPDTQVVHIQPTPQR